MKKQFGFNLIGVLLLIGALVITTGGVLVWQKRALPTPITPSPTPAVPPTTTMSFSQLWQRRDELLGQQVTVRGLVRFIDALSQGCASPEESPCGGLTRTILFQQEGVGSFRLYRSGGPIGCSWRWSNEEEKDCQGWDYDWEDGKEYIITGILGQEENYFYLDVLSRQKL